MSVSCQRNAYHPGFKTVDCLNADNFCPYGEKNCIFGHCPDDKPPPKCKAEAAVGSKVLQRGKSRKTKSDAQLL